MPVKTILCYGDSNTWGQCPGGRYDPDVRWTGVLAAELGSDYRIIEEGLSGRTTVLDDPIEGAHMNGKTYLLPCLKTHRPIDLVIIMLGTNDLKARFSMPAQDIAKGVGVLAGIVMESCAGTGGVAPELLMVAPAVIKENGAFGSMFDGGQDKSLMFAEYYEEAASCAGCHFLDAGSIVESSDIDGVHLDESEHLKLGTVIAEKVRSITGRENRGIIV